MLVKIITVMVLFFLLSIAQVAFVGHINLMGTVPNLIFIFFFLLIFFQNPSPDYHTRSDQSFLEDLLRPEALIIIILGGFFLDVVSLNAMGQAAVVLAVIYFLIKVLFYFLHERQDKHPLIYFVPLFLLFFFGYQGTLYLAGYLAHNPVTVFSLSPEYFIGICYNLLVAVIGFLAYKVVEKYQNTHRQLTLFKS